MFQKAGPICMLGNCEVEIKDLRVVGSIPTWVIILFLFIFCITVILHDIDIVGVEKRSMGFWA